MRPGFDPGQMDSAIMTVTSGLLERTDTSGENADINPGKNNAPSTS